MKKRLHVVDANCGWIRSLAEAMPPSWHVRQYRIYNPQWLPGGKADLLRVFWARQLSASSDEVFCVVPGWNKHPGVSARILQLRLRRSLAKVSEGTIVLFTFPFYSGVAAWVRDSFPRVKIVYHAHDPFEFYGYPEGYIRWHEDRLIPLCDHVLAISDMLSEDFQKRYPTAKVTTFGNAVDELFLMERSATDTSRDLLATIRAAGSPLVGIVGQINSSYDLDLLEQAAERNNTAQLVFIGNLFEEGSVTERIRLLFERPNVHWLGPKPHSELKGYMEACDLLLNPLMVNAHNDRRDTLRLYDYLSTSLPVVSTPIAGVRRHGTLIDVRSSRHELVQLLGEKPRPIPVNVIQRRKAYLATNTWKARAEQLLSIVMQDEASATPVLG